MMTSFVKIAVLLAAVAGTSASDDRCVSFETGHLLCRNISAPPPGSWPHITTLELLRNQITELPKRSLTGFPALEILSLSYNNLTEIDFEDLATVANLSSLHVMFNRIDALTSPPNGTILERLTDIFAGSNRITHLNPDLRLFSPNLRILDITFNPIVLQPGQPILNHSKLVALRMGYGGSQFGAVDASMLSGLPNLRNVELSAAKVTSVDGAFINNKFLQSAELSGNAITEIAPGTFAPEGRIHYLLVDNNPLRSLDIAVVNNTLARGSLVDIGSTPLACECAYEALFNWASTRNIHILAGCWNKPDCSFTKGNKSSAFGLIAL